MSTPYAPMPERTASAAVVSPVPGPVPNGRAVLLVDDEASIRSALRRFFTRRGWQVTEAADGEHARALLLDGEVPGGAFDAIITDMYMPRLCGTALHQLVQARHPSVARRFIFSSGDTGDHEAAAYIADAHCAVLLKPFDLPQLLALVEAMPPVHDLPSH